jgi:hypothetical protein
MWAGQDDNNIHAFSYCVAETIIVRVINGTFQVYIVSQPFQQMAVNRSLLIQTLSKKCGQMVKKLVKGFLHQMNLKHNALR